MDTDCEMETDDEKRNSSQLFFACTIIYLYTLSQQTLLKGTAGTASDMRRLQCRPHLHFQKQLSTLKTNCLPS